MICELCGRDTGFLSSVRIGSTVSRACSGCKRYGTAVGGMTMPSHANPALIMQSRPTRSVVVSVPAEAEKEEVVVSDFSSKISSARQRKGLKQGELARKLMEKESVIKAVETGRRRPNLRLARRLEKTLGVNLVETLE